MNKMTSNAAHRNNFEEGYKPVLVREETKEKLRALRMSMSDRDVNLERRLATAAIEIVIEDAATDPKVLNRLEKTVRGVLTRDWATKDERVTENV